MVTQGSQCVEAAGETCQAGQGDVVLFTAELGHHEWSLPDTPLESYFASFSLDGLEPNRPTFEAIGRYVHEQGLAPRPVKPEELFAPDVE